MTSAPHPCLTRCWRIGAPSDLNGEGRCLECGRPSEPVEVDVDVADVLVTSKRAVDALRTALAVALGERDEARALAGFGKPDIDRDLSWMTLEDALAHYACAMESWRTTLDERDRARADVDAAAGELLVDLQEAPIGSTVARLLIGNRILIDEKKEVQAVVDPLRVAHQKLLLQRDEARASLQTIIRAAFHRSPVSDLLLTTPADVVTEICNLNDLSTHLLAERDAALLDRDALKTLLQEGASLFQSIPSLLRIDSDLTFDHKETLVTAMRHWLARASVIGK